MFLIVVEDRHAESALRRALASVRERGDTAAVLTGDALLAMRLRRESVDARLTTDGLWGGRTTRWVDTNFRALVLEPGFLSMLFVKGFWRRLTQPAAAPLHPDAVIVAGDRFTADVMQRLRTTRQIVLAGATQPGRALF